MRRLVGGGCIYSYVYVCIYICICMYICIYMSIYMIYIYVCIYTCEGVEEVWCVAPVVQQWLLVLAYE